MAATRALLAAAAALLLPAAAQSTTAKGTLSKKTVTMNVVDAVAVWDAKKNELRVVFLPFKAKKEHLEKIQKDETFFSLSDQPSPDPKKWQWCPFGEVKIELDPAKPGRDGVKSLFLLAYGLTERNFTDNINMLPDNARAALPTLVLKLDAAGKAGSIEMNFARKQKLPETDVGWDIQVKGPVLRALKGD